MKTEKTVWDLQGHCPEKATHGSCFDDSRSSISWQTIPESRSVAAGAIMPEHEAGLSVGFKCRQIGH